MSRLSFRSVFVSDVHLGLRDCQAGYLLDFLRSMQCERLYLVGDIIDFENMEKRPWWHADHGHVLAELLAIVARGTRVTYIPGNHDAVLRRFAGQRFAGVDIALDPFPYAGGTTSVESLWMGVPVLTLRGDRYVAHMGESILHNMQMPEWIAADPADYAMKAAAFAGDLPALAALRRDLRHRFVTSPLADAPSFARHFEEALRGMWRKWCGDGAEV